MYVFLYVCMYMCVCVCVCLYVCMYVRTYIHTYKHTHTHTHTHIYIHTRVGLQPIFGPKYNLTVLKLCCCIVLDYKGILCTNKGSSENIWTVH